MGYARMGNARGPETGSAMTGACGRGSPGESWWHLPNVAVAAAAIVSVSHISRQPHGLAFTCAQACACGPDHLRQRLAGRRASPKARAAWICFDAGATVLDSCVVPK